MTKAESAKLVAVMITAYPNSDKYTDAESVESVVNLWAAMFSQDDYSIVSLAISKHIAISKWPPSVAEIREIMSEILNPGLIPPDEAWAAVNDLMATEGEYIYGDIYKQLPPLIARAVECIGYSRLFQMRRNGYQNGKSGTERLAFIQQYTPMYEREKIKAMTPQQINTKIDAIQSALSDSGKKLLEEILNRRREMPPMKKLANFSNNKAQKAKKKEIDEIHN